MTTITVLCSYCAKTPLSLVKAMEDMVVPKLYMGFAILSRVAELIIYIFIFMRQTEIESRATTYIVKGDETVMYRR